MRVIAGSARSLPLKTPDGMETRPTSDRIKETLFNILQGDIPSAVFVDLYSGSGGIGIEALSRGAKKAYFIDNSPKAISCIQSNIAFTRFTDRSVVLKQDAVSALSNIYEKNVDIIFMDPPYSMDYEKTILGCLRNMKYVSEDTLIIVESALKTDFSYVEQMNYEIIREKCYKTNKHVFLKIVRK